MAIWYSSRHTESAISNISFKVENITLTLKWQSCVSPNQVLLLMIEHRCCLSWRICESSNQGTNVPVYQTNKTKTINKKRCSRIFLICHLKGIRKRKCLLHRFGFEHQIAAAPDCVFCIGSI